MKTKDRFICDAFRRYCREQPCANCHAEHSTPAHEISRKRGDGSDALCINLCLNCHRIFDGWGKSKVEKMLELWGLSIQSIHIKLWSGFAHEQGYKPYVTKQEQFEHLCHTYGLQNGSDSKRVTRKKLTKTVNAFPK